MIDKKVRKHEQTSVLPLIYLKEKSVWTFENEDVRRQVWKTLSSRHTSPRSGSF